MEKEQIELEGANKYGPYSAGVKAGGTIWLSGQIDVEAGDDLCFAQVLLADINDFAAMNEVYGAWVEDIEVRPARAAFAAAALPAGALVEIVVQGACRTSF